jgi:hypothetical protein
MKDMLRGDLEMLLASRMPTGRSHTQYLEHGESFRTIREDEGMNKRAVNPQYVRMEFPWFSGEDPT